MEQKTPNPKTTASPSTDGGDLGASEVQHAFDKAQEQGFWGEEVDQTPNEAYTLQGGPAGVGTPEGDRMLGKDKKGN